MTIIYKYIQYFYILGLQWSDRYSHGSRFHQREFAMQWILSHEWSFPWCETHDLKFQKIQHQQTLKSKISPQMYYLELYRHDRICHCILVLWYEYDKWWFFSGKITMNNDLVKQSKVFSLFNTASLLWYFLLSYDQQIRVWLRISNKQESLPPVCVYLQIYLMTIRLSALVEERISTLTARYKKFVSSSRNPPSSSSKKSSRCAAVLYFL